MNGMAKAGGIISIIAAAFGILSSLILIFFGWLFSSGLDANGVGGVFLVFGIIILVISILMIVWSSKYMKSGEHKVKLIVFSIIAAVLSLGSWISLILYVLAAIFIGLGKSEEE